MKKIKFRAKSRIGNNWKYGFLTKTCEDSGDKYWIDVSDKDTCNDSYEVYPDTIGQYTGVEDLEQNEIFEGDIFIPLYFPPCTTVEKAIQLHEFDKDNIGVVTFEYGNTILKKKYYRDKQLSDYIEQEFSHYESNVGEIYKYKNNIALGKVIGNIYDNPKLLEVK